MSTPSPSLLSRPAGRFRSPASLATAAAVIAPSLLQAQIIWSGTLNAPVNTGTPAKLLDFNLNTVPDDPEAYLNWFNDGKSSPSLSVYGITSAKSDPSIAFLYNDTPVSFGATIDASLNGYIGEHPTNLVPADGAPRYFAFQYQAAGGPYFGWMQLTFSADLQTGTLNQWAYKSARSGGASGSANRSSLERRGRPRALRRSLVSWQRFCPNPSRTSCGDRRVVWPPPRRRPHRPHPRSRLRPRLQSTPARRTPAPGPLRRRGFLGG
jgi:hypothetical protein